MENRLIDTSELYCDQSKVLMSSRDLKEEGRNTAGVSTFTIPTIKLIEWYYCKYPKCKNLAVCFFNSFCDNHSKLLFKDFVSLEEVYSDEISLIKSTITNKVINNERLTYLVENIKYKINEEELQLIEVNKDKESILNILAIQLSDSCNALSSEIFSKIKIDFRTIDNMLRTINLVTKEYLTDFIFLDESMENYRSTTDDFKYNIVYFLLTPFKTNDSKSNCTFKCYIDNRCGDIPKKDLNVDHLCNVCLLNMCYKSNLCTNCELINDNYRQLGEHVVPKNVTSHNSDCINDDKQTNKILNSFEATNTEVGIDFNDIEALDLEKECKIPKVSMDSLSKKSTKELTIKNPFSILKDYGESLPDSKYDYEEEFTRRIKLIEKDIKNNILYIKDVKGDGYCGFRSIFMQLKTEDMNKNFANLLLNKIREYDGGKSDWFSMIAMKHALNNYGYRLFCINKSFTKYACMEKDNGSKEIILISDFGDFGEIDQGTHFTGVSTDRDYIDLLHIKDTVEIEKKWTDSDTESENNDIDDQQSELNKSDENLDSDSNKDEENEESEDEDSDIDMDDFKVEEEKQLDDCCEVPSSVEIDNFNIITHCLKQFKGNNPKYECLFNLLEISKVYLENLDKMSYMQSESVDFLKNYLKFRHNTFAYLFTLEIIRIPDLFDNEMQLKYIDSNKTPDLVIYNITPKMKSVTIYEFTVVMSALRANFLKGVNKKDSKYKQQIVDYENLGFEVVYNPIYFSLGNTVEENVNSWIEMGFEVNNSAIELMKKYQSHLEIRFNYLFSFSFDKEIDRSFDESKKWVDNQLTVEESWRIQIVKANKKCFYKFLKFFKDYEFIDEEKYTVRRIKGNNNFTIKLVTRIDNNMQKTGFFYNKLKKDDFLIFQEFKNIVVGQDKCYIYTKQFKDDLLNFKPTHGKYIINYKPDKGPNFKNKKNFNMYSIGEMKKYEKVLESNSMDDLNHEFDLNDIKKSLNCYKIETAKYLTENHSVTPPIFNDPRRSFLTLIDSDSVTDIQYSNGIQTSDLNIAEIKSNAVKNILSRKDQVSYVVCNDAEDITLKISYKSAMQDLYSFIEKHSISRLKISLALRTLNGALKEELKGLHDKYKLAQQKYVKMHDKISKPGTLPIDNQIRSMIKNEANWSSNRGYRLYMGKHNSITDLFDLMKQITKPLHLNINFPANDFDSQFFKSLKEKCMTEFDEHYKELRTTKLFQNCIFLSRLAYTLLSLSNKTFNHKKVALDNLGLTNTVLIVKGGKKLTTTRKTKIFKLIYPCEKDLQHWNKDVSMSGNYYFDETNWMQLNQNVLMDLISAPYKLLSNYLYLREKNNITSSFDMISMPTLLLFHNRRKTEIMLHSMRYLIVNPISVFSQVDKMLLEFSGPCYSAFDHSIRIGLSDRYLNYVKSIRKWSEFKTNDNNIFEQSYIPHPYLSRSLKNIDDLTYTIYSTYMMSKGHYEQSVEQVINFKSILETHKTYLDSNKKHSFNIANKDEVEKLKKDDFGFSPHISYLVGKFLSAELKQKYSQNHLISNWNNILSKPIDSMANNRGLRYKGKDFFGHKGYFVIYKELFNNGFKEVEELLASSKDDREIHKKLFELNQTFYKTQEKIDLEEVIFHVVDKSQRGGHREIYVMDYSTKLYQNPLEQMFKVICEFIDNEIISVPAARRSGLIHHKCFEFRSDKYETYYLSYDCRKWAPRSNTDKYIYMLMGMQDVLPQDFLNSCLHYFDQHRKKKIYTRKEIKEKLLTNPSFEEYKNYLIDDEEKQGAFFKMPYSFVMGIFNMLSSLLHAGGQIYMKYLLEKDLLEKGHQIDLDMYAHSDDSGGRLSIDKTSNEGTAYVKTIIGKYEFTQKCLNHLMSVKKCNTSLNYFELLSILYINNELLPVLPKFLGNINLTFSGQGLSSDMKQIISKSIELQANGATASLAYKVQLIMSNMYRNFYRVNVDTQIPALGGSVNTWPTLYNVYGSACDEVRSCIFNYNFYSKLTTFAIENLEYEIQDGTINLKFSNVLRMPKAYHAFKKQLKLPDFEDASWFFEQNKTRHSLLNLYWFRAKLDSSNFALSILNINDIRRAYDSLYMATKSHILGKYKIFNINSLILNVMNTEPNVNNHENTLRVMYRKLFQIFEWSEVLPRPIFKPKTRLTIKPCTLSLTNFVESPITEYNSLHLAAQMIRPELLKYTFTNKRYGTELEAMRKYLTNLGVNQDIKTVKNFLDYIQKNKNLVNNFYASVTSDQRAMNGNEGLVELVFSNFHPEIQISNISNRYHESKHLQKDIDEKISNMVLCYYFYNIFRKTRDDSIASIEVNKKFTNGKVVLMNQVPEMLNNSIKVPGVLPYLHLLEFQEPHEIVLSNLTNWAIWTDRQGKVGNEWVGKGTFEISLDNVTMKFTVLNREITKVEHKINTTMTFSDLASSFFNKLCKQFNVNYFYTITPQEGTLHFGINEFGNLGFFSGNNIILGIQETVHSQMFDPSRYALPVLHNYISGNHYIEMNKYNYHLYTVDEIIFKENKPDIFDVVDWDNLDNKLKNLFMRSMFSGDYGRIDMISYDKEQLIDKFLSTDIYRFFYNTKLKGNTLNQEFWNDIIYNIEYKEDIFPTLFENLGLQELEKILPKEKKDNVALYLFYDNDDNDLLYLRNKLQKIDDEKEKVIFISKIITKIQDSQGLVTLPEIGDPDEFKKIKFNKLPKYTMINVISTLSKALFNGLQSLSRISISKFDEISKNKITKDTDIEKIFYSEMYFKNEKSNILSNYIGLTVDQMVLHRLMELVFSEKSAFSDFARTFRNTFLKNCPRHPVYESEWHIILANCFKFSYCMILNDLQKNMVDSTVQRELLLSKSKKSHSAEELVVEENLNDIDTSITPAILKIFLSTNDLEDEELSSYSVTQSKLDQFIFLADEANEQKSLYSEYIEDEVELDPIFKRKKPGMKIKFIDNLNNLINWANSSIGNQNNAIAIPFFEPKYRPKQINLETKIGIKTLFVYNLNNNSKIEHLPRQINLNKYFKKFINYYQDEEEVAYTFDKIERKEIQLDVNVKPVIESIKSKIQVDSNESYDNNLLEYLKEEFSLDETTEIAIKEVIEHKRITPITKFMRIKQLINKKIANTDVMDNIEKMIKDIFLKAQPNVKLNLKSNFKKSIGKTSNDPSKLIENLTSYKKEFKQLDTVTNDKFGKLLTENITLSQTTADHLIVNFKLLLKQLQFMKLKDQAGYCKTIIDVISTVKIGEMTTESRAFDEECRICLTDLAKLVNNDDDDDISKLEAPRHEVEDWKLMIRRKKN